MSAESSSSSDGQTIDIGTTSSYFGDHNGAIGCLAGDGSVLVLERDSGGSGCGEGSAEIREKRQSREWKGRVALKPLGSTWKGPEFGEDEDDVRFGLVAMAGNGSLVAVPWNSCHSLRGGRGGSARDIRGADGTLTVYVFETLKNLSTWVAERDVENKHKKKKGASRFLIAPENAMQGRGEHIKAVQLLAIATSYAVLLDDGSVYTWGDARYPSTLGRDVWMNDNSGTDDNSRTGETPAHLPGQVTALGGLRVRKIVGNGWYMAALTEDDEAYVWGGRPGDDRLIRDVRAAKKDDSFDRGDVGEERDGNDGNEEIHLIEIPSVQDILDIGLGCSHLVVLALMDSGEEKVLGVGMGENGQLGLGKVVLWSRDFVEPVGFAPCYVSDDHVTSDYDDAKKAVAGVWCGEYSTYVALA